MGFRLAILGAAFASPQRVGSVPFEQPGIEQVVWHVVVLVREWPVSGIAIEPLGAECELDLPKRFCLFHFAVRRSLSSKLAGRSHDRIGLERLETRCCPSAPRAIPPFEADFFHVPAESDATLPGRPQPLNQRAAAGAFLDLGGGLVVFLTNEAAQRRDLNGDGDKLDDVLQIFDAASGIVQNTGQAVG